MCQHIFTFTMNIINLVLQEYLDQLLLQKPSTGVRRAHQMVNPALCIIRSKANLRIMIFYLHTLVRDTDI